MTIRNPQSENEWIVHSINIHGFFFESWCRSVVESANRWKVVSTNEPVGLGGKESNLDIWAEFRSATQNKVLNLLIECKKHKPEFKKWIFFSKQPVPEIGSVVIPEVVVEKVGSTSERLRVNAKASRKYPHNELYITNEGQEVRGEYIQIDDDKTKTNTDNTSIMEAMYKVALATQSIFYDVKDDADRFAMGKTGSKQWRHQSFLPIVVTTARLFACEFEPNEVDASSGEIDLDKANIIEKSYLIYEYPLPKHLQSQERHWFSTLDELERQELTRLNIVIVNSNSLHNFVRNLDISGFW
jgi:hypothetical protein